MTPPRESVGPRLAPFGGDQAADVADAYTKGAAVKALAPQYRVAPKTIRRALDAAGARDVGDVLEESHGAAADAEGHEPVPAPEQAHTIAMPGLLAEHLGATEAAEIREALRGGRTIRRGQGYSVRVTAPNCTVPRWPSALPSQARAAHKVDSAGRIFALGCAGNALVRYAAWTTRWLGSPILLTVSQDR